MELLVDSDTTLSGSKNQVQIERGRPPWFGPDAHSRPTYMIGVAGGSASGKTSVAQRIIKALGVPWVLVVSQDSFYNSLNAEQSQKAFANEHDFDCPDAFDYELLRDRLIDLRDSRAVQIPVYSFKEHQRMPETQYLYGASVVIVEGIFVLHDPAIRDLLDLKVFVQCDSDIMLARRIRRDIQERGRDVEGVLAQYLKFVKPSFDNFVLPTSRHADIIVPGFSNDVAIDIIVTHIRKQLDERNMKLRNTLSRSPLPFQPKTPKPGSKQLSYSEHSAECDSVNLSVLPQTKELEELHRCLRSARTDIDRFVKYSDQLSTLLIEHALSLLSASEARHGQTICGVTIAGVGARLERGLHTAMPEAELGSLTIESHANTSEPLLCRTDLPTVLRHSASEAAKALVLLLDSQVGTGAAAIMALRVLLDHGVKEENIVLVCFVCSRRGGCQALSQAFPRVRIVTSAVDEGVEHLLTDGHTSAQAGQTERGDRQPWTSFLLSD